MRVRSMIQLVRQVEPFGADYPAGLALAEDWEYLGRVLDMFALSDLTTRPGDHPVADQAAEQIRRWIVRGVPRSG